MSFLTPGGQTIGSYIGSALFGALAAMIGVSFDGRVGAAQFAIFGSIIGNFLGSYFGGSYISKRFGNDKLEFIEFSKMKSEETYEMMINELGVESYFSKSQVKHVFKTEIAKLNPQRNTHLSERKQQELRNQLKNKTEAYHFIKSFKQEKGEWTDNVQRP